MDRHAFISHSHKDAEAADAIVAALESRGVKCWTAPRDVPPGGSYAAAILTAIESASCFVLVYTEHSNVSPHVLREVERALSLGINIMPLRFDDSSVSKSLDYLLATVHWLSVIGEPRQTAIHDAAERIASCVNEGGPPVAIPAPVAVVPAGGGRTVIVPWLLLFLVALSLIGLAAFAVYRFTARNNNPPVVVATPTALPMFTPTITPIPVAVVENTPAPPPAATPFPTVVETPTPTETEMAVPEATAPLPTPPPFNDSPLSAIHRYYGYLGDHNTIRAYELLSAAYRQRENFVNYTRAFASTSALRLSSARLLENNGESATVSVTFEKDNRRFGWITWSGPVRLVLDPDGWRIESVSGIRALPRRR
ncbi:MAG TPA: toll/interleukin-1 receptor domain-containing protein [Steroidobacteraceae bacterium]|nr:toll/interleukin-1 receptor domain-containing protein [Steroidobacteraceae bacterium]